MFHMLHRSIVLAPLLAVAIIANVTQAAADSDAVLLQKLNALLKQGKISRAELELFVCKKTACGAEPGGASNSGASANIKAVATGPSRKPAPSPFAAPSVDLTVNHTLLLRDIYSPIAFITQGSDLSQNGATFSVTTDQRNHDTTFVGKGALMLASHGNVDPDNLLHISHFAFTPGVEWDRKVVNGKDSGSTSGRIGLELETLNDRPFPTQYWRATAIYTTDAKTRANVYGFEGSWHPYNLADYPIAINAKRAVAGTPFIVGLYPNLSLNYSYAESPGEFAGLLNSKRYFWLGGQVRGTLGFAKDSPFSRISFYTDYTYLYEALRPGENNVNYLETGAQYKIADLPATVFTNSGELTLKGHYANGVVPRTLDRITEWYVGLIVKLGSISPSSK